MVKDYTVLTQADIDERYALYDSWQQALVMGDYIKADELRLLYKEWDELLGNPGTWIPLFESSKHKYARVQRNRGV